MLDKIKTLRQLIEYKANDLGILFEELLEDIDDDYKLRLFIEQIDKVYYLTTLEGICKSPLFEYSKIIEYLYNSFSIDITKDEYIKVLKKKVLDILEKPNYRTAETIFLINHSDRDIYGRTNEFRQNNINRFKAGNLNWNPIDEYKSAKLFESNVNKIIKDLGIDIKDSKYKVLILDGDEEYEKYISLFKFNVSNRDVYLLSQSSNIGNYCIDNYNLKYVARHPQISIDLLPYSINEVNDRILFIKNNYNNIIRLDKFLTTYYECDKDQRLMEHRKTWNSEIWNHPDEDIKKEHERTDGYLRLVVGIEYFYKLINSEDFKEIQQFLYFPIGHILKNILSKFNKSGYPKSHYYSNDYQKNHLFELRKKVNKINLHI